MPNLTFVQEKRDGEVCFTMVDSDTIVQYEGPELKKFPLKAFRFEEPLLIYDEASCGRFPKEDIKNMPPNVDATLTDKFAQGPDSLVTDEDPQPTGLDSIPEEKQQLQAPVTRPRSSNNLQPSNPEPHRPSEPLEQPSRRSTRLQKELAYGIRWLVE